MKEEMNHWWRKCGVTGNGEKEIKKSQRRGSEIGREGRDG